MSKPDGSHDRLPVTEAAAVDRVLRFYGLTDGPEPVRAWNPLVVPLLCALVVGIVLGCGAVLFYGNRDQGVLPDPVVVTSTPTATPSLTPYPRGWVPR